jgi:hypothetical protein
MDGSTSLLTPTEACEILRISRATLAVMERTGRLAPVDIGHPNSHKRLLRYRRADLDNLISGNRV